MLRPLRSRTVPSPVPVRLTAEPLANPPAALKVRLVLALRSALVRLADRLSPAELVLSDRSTGIASTALLGAVARYGIADYLHEHGPSTAESIACGLHLHGDTVHRTLRALASTGIFAMSRDGVFANNRLSRLLCSGAPGSSREWALYFASASVAAAWLDYPGTLETGESAFARVHGMNMWEWFDRHPDERALFAHCMMSMTIGDASTIATLYPFAELARICDVGGGRGTLLSEILLRHRGLSGILCDAPGVVESARELLEARGIADRVELAPGDFFHHVPPGCDAYLLKHILHDWDDRTCTKLLEVIRTAARPGSRVILCEALVERTSREPLTAFSDLQMMIACHNGRERGLDEFRSLLESARFRFVRVFRAPLINVIEGQAV